VDGARGIQFAIQKDPESVELRSVESDEQIPLAIHLFSYDESGILPSAFSVMPVDGQNMDFEIQVQQSPFGETFGTLVYSISRDESLPATKGANHQRSAQRPDNANVASSKQGSESTRTAEWVTDPAVLLTIKRVYVDPLGDSSVSHRVREVLTTNLRSSNRFV